MSGYAQRHPIVNENDDCELGFTQAADEILDYGFDWSRVLGKEAITVSNWVTGDDLAEAATTFDGYITTVQLYGGQVGGSYRVTNHITTDLGNIYERSFTIEIRER